MMLQSSSIHLRWFASLSDFSSGWSSLLVHFLEQPSGNCRKDQQKSLASFEKGVERRLTSDLSQAVLVGKDQILVYRNDSLVALSLDPKSLEISGSIQDVGSRPLYAPSSGALAASADGAGDIAYALSSGEGMGASVLAGSALDY